MSGRRGTHRRRAAAAVTLTLTHAQRLKYTIAVGLITAGLLLAGAVSGAILSTTLTTTTTCGEKQ